MYEVRDRPNNGKLNGKENGRDLATMGSRMYRTSTWHGMTAWERKWKLQIVMGLIFCGGTNP